MKVSNTKIASIAVSWTQVIGLYCRLSQQLDYYVNHLHLMTHKQTH